jgi:hypothetical protein
MPALRRPKTSACDRAWAQRFASYGYVPVFVNANDASSDSEATPADGLWAAIAAVEAKNTRADGPVAGNLSG